jgi:hypothetical protein
MAGKILIGVSTRHHPNEIIAARANDVAVWLQTGDLIQKSQSISTRKSMEEKQTWPKYTSSELIVNNAESFGNLLENHS